MTNSHTPLAALMRPKNFDEFIGQEHIVGKGKTLRKLIEQDQLRSLILWGPPGCGKTSLAFVIASVTKSHFEYLSGVDSSLQDLRKIISQAETRRTILTIDEIHRWNRSQQAALLPHVEEGTLILIGCTTENPYFEVIGPLLSRSTIYKLNPLSDKDIGEILNKALKILKAKTSKEILNIIIQYSNGDARKALNILEGATSTSTSITRHVIEDVIQKRTILYDKDKDAHYDTISAFIKSMRGSDPDATIFYLVKMLEAGEEPKFIARRIFILASEDIGNADPAAINVAASAFEAVEKIGLPEAEFALAQAAIYMACAPKSNAIYRALAAAKKDLAEKGAGEVPLHIRNAPHKGMEKFGYGKNYKYPHLYEEGFAVGEEYLPNHLKGAKYYQPSGRGYEKIIKARLEYWRKLIKSRHKKDIECKIKEKGK